MSGRARAKGTQSLEARLNSSLDDVVQGVKKAKADRAPQLAGGAPGRGGGGGRVMRGAGKAIGRDTAYRLWSGASRQSGVKRTISKRGDQPKGKGKSKSKSTGKGQGKQKVKGQTKGKSKGRLDGFGKGRQQGKPRAAAAAAMREPDRGPADRASASGRATKGRGRALVRVGGKFAANRGSKRLGLGLRRTTSNRAAAGPASAKSRNLDRGGGGNYAKGGRGKGRLATQGYAAGTGRGKGKGRGTALGQRATGTKGKGGRSTAVKGKGRGRAAGQAPLPRSNEPNMNRSVLFTGADFGTPSSTLLQHFERAGDVSKFSLYTLPNGQSRGMGLCEYTKPFMAEKAADLLSGHAVEGYRVDIELFAP